MAVLIEAISVVIRADRLLARLSWDDFKATVPNATLCADGELVRVGFMHPDDVRVFIEGLEAHGLRYLAEGHAIDMVVVDQQRGAAVPCDWIEIGSIDVAPGATVKAARLAGSQAHQLMKPDDWRFEGSLSQTFGFVPNGTSADQAGLELQEDRDGLHTLRSRLTRSDVFIGRPSNKRTEHGGDGS